jgi:hypothetical protein
VLTYSFIITNWRSQKIQKIDRKIRKMLTVCKIHHPKANTQAVCKNGRKRRGLLIIEAAHKLEIIDIADCLRTKRK